MEDIQPIQWSNEPFASLTIPVGKKEVIMTVTQNRLGQPKNDERSGTKVFGDVIEGKGCGVNMLL